MYIMRVNQYNMLSLFQVKGGYEGGSISSVHYESTPDKILSLFQIKEAYEGGRISSVHYESTPVQHVIPVSG